MKSISREHTVPANRRCEIQDPVAEVELGEAFLVETVNFRTPIVRTPQDANPGEYREREETGPIAVKGIDAGDVLAVHIEDIQPEGHASGGWWRDPDENSFLPIEGERVHFPGGLWAPRRMMIGDIYVLPSAPCSNPHDNGGNMDFKDVAAGNTLLLRAQVPGGLLVLGDLHAAQGDGEMLGLAAECAGEVRMRVTRDDTYYPRLPTIVKSSSFVSIASRKDYAEARDVAVEDAKRILARVAGCTEEEAYLYIMTVGDLRNGAIWPMGKHDMPLVVGVEVPLNGSHGTAAKPD